MIDWVGAIVQGTLLGGLYALFAAGLSLIFGIMRLVNIESEMKNVTMSPLVSNSAQWATCT